eukprot:1530022-Amphidinium_carterae.1
MDVSKIRCQSPPRAAAPLPNFKGPPPPRGSESAPRQGPLPASLSLRPAASGPPAAAPTYPPLPKHPPVHTRPEAERP